MSNLAACKTARNKKIARLKILQKENRMDDSTYRNFLERLTNKRSAKDLSDKQLVFVINKLSGGHKDHKASKVSGAVRANADVMRKIKALWISAYWLGVVDNNNDAAINAFIVRTAKISHGSWLTPQRGYVVIEALKAMLERAGVNWKNGRSHAQEQVIEAQWRKLHEAGVVQHLFALDSYAAFILKIRETEIRHLSTDEMDKLIIGLGRKLRKAMGR